MKRMLEKSGEIKFNKTLPNSEVCLYITDNDIKKVFGVVQHLC